MVVSVLAIVSGTPGQHIAMGLYDSGSKSSHESGDHRIAVQYGPSGLYVSLMFS